jgi:stearoyl-CoA desaturase (delta-9 desaturase)
VRAFADLGARRLGGRHASAIDFPLSRSFAGGCGYGRGSVAAADIEAARARSAELRRIKSIGWHLWDATRNILLPTSGLVWVAYSLCSGRVHVFELALFAISVTAVGLGTSVGLHRYFTHRSFSARPALKRLLAVMGSMAWQRALLLWVARHRLHHYYADATGDYHSPHVLFDGTRISRPWLKALHSHYAWVHVAEPNDATVARLTEDLKDDPFVAWCDRHYDLFCVLTVVIPGLLGAAWYGSIAGAVSAAMWGGLAPVAVVLHMTWFVNSASHLRGAATYETGDESRNIPLLGWIAFGEGYHNNHHAFPYSPRIGFDRGQVDTGWYFIWLCRWLGLAHDLKPVPSLWQRNHRHMGRPITRNESATG